MDTMMKQRFLQDRVLTASPAQRVVMLYDRLALDLTRARTDASLRVSALEHAAQIVAELAGSLDRQAGDPADNLGALYGWMLREIVAAQLGSSDEQLGPIEDSVRMLREAWAAVAMSVAVTPAAGWTA